MSAGVFGERAPAWSIAASAAAAAVAASAAIAIAAPWLAPERATPVAVPAPAAPRAASPAPRVAAVAPAAAPRPTERDCGRSIALHFGYDASTPPDDTLGQLAPVLAYATAHPDMRITVDGHADPSGDEVGNVILSKRRARRVAQLIVGTGVARAHVVERAFGAYVPGGGDRAAEQRRVQVSIRDPRCGEEEHP